MPLTAAAGTVIAAGISAAGNYAVAGSGKKKAYKYNTMLQQQQYEQNQKLAEQQNQYNRENAEIEYQRNVEQWKRENEEYQRRWEQQRSEDLAQWNRQNDFNLQQRDYENYYNSPAAQMERMRAAGLNPNADYSGSSAASMPANPAPASGDIGVANSPQLKYSDAAGYPVQGGSGVSDSMPSPFSGLLNAVQGYFSYNQKQQMNDVLIDLYRSQIDKNELDSRAKRYNIDNLLPLDLKLKQTKSDANYLDFQFKNDTYEQRFQALQLANRLFGSRIENIDKNTDLLKLKHEFQQIINKYAEPNAQASLSYKQLQNKYSFVNQKVTEMLVTGKDSQGNELDSMQKQWLLATQGILPSISNPIVWRIGADFLREQGVGNKPFLEEVLDAVLQRNREKPPRGGSF